MFRKNVPARHAFEFCGKHFCILGIFILTLGKAAGDSAVLNVSYIRDNQGENSQKRSYASFCVAYNPELSKLPLPSDPTKWMSLKYGGDDLNLCDEPYRPEDWSSKMLMAPRRNCSASDQMLAAAHHHASGLIIVAKRMFHPGQPNKTAGSVSPIPVMIINEKHLLEILELPFSESWEVSFYGLPEGDVIEWSGVCLIIIAVSVITIGSCRSGRHRFVHIEEQFMRRKNAMEPEVAHAQTGVHVGSLTVVIFAGFMTGLLLLMYFFYDYLVLVFIGLFVIGATSGMFECFKPVLSLTTFGSWKIPVGKGCMGKFCGSDVDIRSVVLFLLSTALPVTWVFVRNESYGWVFLDILGCFLLISVLVGIQLPNLKACTIFLCLLFIYDIFFVFITPFFTKDGQSVMIQVATGGYDPTRDSGSGQREMIPAAFKIPRIPTGRLCENVFEESSYSLLGFGDIMVPGFLISFLRSFELVTKIPAIYSTASCVGYLVSLIITTAALVLMKTGQPALLYIVPILLVIVFSIAWKRREVKILWNGNLGTLYETLRENTLEKLDPEAILPDMDGPRFL